MSSRRWLGAALAPAGLGLLFGLLLAGGLLPRSFFVLRLLIGADLFAIGAGLLVSALAVLAWCGRVWYERRLHDVVVAERQSHAAARQRFVHRLNHELKNPLTVMQAGLANMADRDGRDTSLESVQRQVERLSRLVGQLQKLAELESREIERVPVELPEIIEEVVELVHAAPEWSVRTIQVRVQAVPWHPHPVQGDRDLLLLALYNVLDNALKFSPREAVVEVRAGEDGECALVEVADTGRGIPAEDVAHVTEELYRGRDTQGVEGSGLGLALVEKIVTLHRGTLGVRSRHGEGTVVALRLPLAKEEPVSKLLQARDAVETRRY